MESIAEKARLEAEQAEADEHDDEHADEQADEPNEEPAAEPPHDPAEGLEEPTDQMVAELQAACNDHHDHVRQILGGFVAGWVPCAACNGIGLDLPQPDAPKHADAPQTVTCNVCHGLGELKTGSIRQGFELIQCVRCNGKGYVGPDNLPADTAAQRTVEAYPQQPDGQQPEPAGSQPPTTDPRVEALRAEGFIVLEKPGT